MIEVAIAEVRRYNECAMSDNDTIRRPLTGVKLNLRTDVRERFATFCVDHGWLQADTLGRLVDWFMEMDETARLLVMHQLHADDEPAVTCLVLERLAAANTTVAAESAGVVALAEAVPPPASASPEPKRSSGRRTPARRRG